MPGVFSPSLYTLQYIPHIQKFVKLYPNDNSNNRGCGCKQNDQIPFNLMNLKNNCHTTLINMIILFYCK